MRLRLECAVLVLLVPLGVAADYVMVDLGDPPEGYRQPNVRELNDGGQVVGTVNSEDFAEHVFVWEDGNWTILPTLGGRWAVPTGFNNQGQVVGVGETDDVEVCVEVDGGQECFFFVRGFVWERGETTELGYDDFGSQAGGISNAGTVAGWYDDASGRVPAVWDASGRVTPLGSDLGGWVTPEGINTRGQVVGAASTGTEGHPFVWDRRGGMIDLGTLGGPGGRAEAINAWGTVVGEADTDEVIECGPEETCPHVGGAFVWEDGVMTQLPGLGGPNAHAVDINDHGVVVGSADTDDPSFCHDGGTFCVFFFHAVVWVDGQVIDLDEDGQQSYAAAINNKGEIAGEADSRPVIWRPVDQAVSRLRP